MTGMCVGEEREYGVEHRVARVPMIVVKEKGR